MKNNSQIKFVTALQNSYFHFDRKYESDEIKRTAFHAMMLLWSANGFEYEAQIYSQDMIRHMMLEKMTPDDLDRAIRRWKGRGETSAEQLCRDLFLTVVLSNALALFHQVLSGEGIPIECKLKLEIVA